MDVSDLVTVFDKQRCLLCNRIFPLGDDLRSCPADGSLLLPVEQDKMLGQVIGNKYEIKELLGSGGWSRVYKANHIHLQKEVAVKILDSNLSADPLALRRFEAEAKSTYGLMHSGIVAVYDHGVLPQPYIVMELVEGKTLEQLLEERGYIGADEAVPIFEQICSAMAHAHEHGFVHRDLKPSNIMLVNASMTAKVLDFGLVKSMYQHTTQTGDTVGSPPYMSPEQCRGQELDGTSDVYSLGCIMYETLTGIRAFSGETAIECMYKHFTQAPVPLKDARKDLAISSGLERVVGKATEVEKSDRYKSMNELLADLGRVKTNTVKARWNRYKVRYKRTVSSAARVSRWGIVTIVSSYILMMLPLWLRGPL